MADPASTAFGISKKHPCMKARFPNLTPTGSWSDIKKLSMPACWDRCLTFRVSSMCPVRLAVALFTSNGFP